MLNLNPIAPTLGERQLILATLLSNGFAFRALTGEGVKGMGWWVRNGRPPNGDALLFWDGAREVYATLVQAKVVSYA